MTNRTIYIVTGEDSAAADFLRELKDLGLSAERAEDWRTVPHDAACIVVGRHFNQESLAQSLRLAFPSSMLVAHAYSGSAHAARLVEQGVDEVLQDGSDRALWGMRLRLLLDLHSAKNELTARARSERLQAEIELLLESGIDGGQEICDVLNALAVHVGWDTASLVIWLSVDEPPFVIATNRDDGNPSVITVEHEEVLLELHRSLKPLVISDVETHPQTIRVAGEYLAKRVKAKALFPILWRGRMLGFFELSHPHARTLVPQTEAYRLCTWLAYRLAPELQDSEVLERLSDSTRRISRVDLEAERRMRVVESLKEHFEASGEGVVVLDERGDILFVNGPAESMTGFAKDGLLGTCMLDLVTSNSRELLEDAFRQVLSGKNLEAFDVELLTTSGRPIVVSMTSSTVLSRTSAAVFVFRDVTAQRNLEGQLQQTKYFLEKLIDSTVDAIIAADMTGCVILFNSGAERICGYDASEVVGKLFVQELYSEGGAEAVMRLLRSDTHGGIGRLESTRREIRHKNGEFIPVNMTASIIYEDGQEVATVGVFSDLRDRIRIEQRLIEAQSRLERQERQTMVAQLAGAAAHELNQPLTAIMALIELTNKRGDQGELLARNLQLVEAEAVRMANIVKTIGQLTQYEVKEYVGSTAIVDLEKSAGIRAETAPGDEAKTQKAAIPHFISDLGTSQSHDPHEPFLKETEEELSAETKPRLRNIGESP